MSQNYLQLPMTVDIDIGVELESGALEEKLAQRTSIDEANLSQELARNPSEATTWLAAKNLAELEVDRRKKELAIVEAQIGLQYRQNPPAGKPTVDIIAGMVMNHPQYRAADAQLFEAKKVLAILEAAKAGFDKKQDSLRELNRRQLASLLNAGGEGASMSGQDLSPRALTGQPRRASSGARSDNPRDLVDSLEGEL